MKKNHVATGQKSSPLMTSSHSIEGVMQAAGGGRSHQNAQPTGTLCVA